ncbi:MAG: hypothetical protein R3F56_10965 [Planctomycetota bacterium]
MSDRGDHAFLGEEFLTWLWYRLETVGGDFDIGEGRHVAVAMDDFLAFAPRDDDETEQTLRKGTPTHSQEARAALRNGRRLRKAKLVVAEGPMQFGATLDGTTMCLSGIKLPDDSEDCESARDRNVERAAGFFLVHELVGHLYTGFLQDRLRPDYARTAGERQAQWMAG